MVRVEKKFSVYNVNLKDGFNAEDFMKKFSMSRFPNNHYHENNSFKDYEAIIYPEYSDDRFICGLFVKEKKELPRKYDRDNNNLSEEDFDEDGEYFEVSHFCIDLDKNICLGEYNHDGIRNFNHFDKYLQSRDYNLLDLEFKLNENVKNNFINSTVTNYLNLKLSLRDLNLLGDIIPINQSQLRSLSGNDEDIKVDVILTGKMQLSSEYKKNLFTNERKVSKFKAEVDNENINFLLSHLHKRIVVDCIRTKKYLNKIDVFNKLKDELNREN